VIAGVIGAEEMARWGGPILFLFLFVLVAGSFACLQSLVDSIRRRQLKFLAQMVVVQAFVMFFEVMFLYRELVRAMTPWLMEQGNIKLTLTTTLVAAALAWIGVRVSTWFLFAQYGTPALLAFIARQPLPATELLTATRPEPHAWWRPAINDFRRDIDWLHAKGEHVLELVALPVLQLLGAAVNFGMILTAGHPAFGVPFKDLREATEPREVEGAAHAHARS